MLVFSPTSVLVTGGAGFIGSALVRQLLSRKVSVVVLDALTYAGHRVNLDLHLDDDSANRPAAKTDALLTFVHGDIQDRALLVDLFQRFRFDAVCHLAAESHVDRSIESAGAFIQTNVVGTFTLIDVALRAWQAAKSAGRFLHVSTDEVFGSLGSTGHFTEQTAYAPNSPYAASKAASDLIVRSYVKTHGFNAITTNTCNNYGPRQLPEKLIPLMVSRAMEGKPLPVYGRGQQIREWLHVEDHVHGLLLALERGRVGETYNLGSGEEYDNLSLVRELADLVDAQLGRKRGTSQQHITYVEDRKGHDFRYAIDSTKARRELGFAPSRTLAQGLTETIQWYLTNHAWRAAVASSEHERFQSAHYGLSGQPAARGEP